ncbi:glycosyltransferase [Gorillibacterium sp. sgz5001074]|uniref:glycosyltransferase n=1 Tax=Gorillibacterium sp. sgz5001074 TaxID=3446695 RepID=UPI003F67CBF7
MIPKVSIIIPFYCDPYVPNAIQSALDQTYPNTEIIIVSDGSHSYNELLIPYLSHPKVHFLEKGNGGTASALNAGIRAATGDYVAWLSSDDMFYPWKLAHQMAYMILNRARISFSDYDIMNEHGQVTGSCVGLKFPTAIEFYRTFLTGNPVNGCTVVASRHLMLELGLFDEGLPYTHDYDLWFRVILSKVDFHFVNENLIKYRVHSGMGTHRHLPTIMAEAERTKGKWAWQMMHHIKELGG